MARSVAALAWAASFDAVAQKLFGIGREMTDGFVQAQMDQIERTEKIDAALTAINPLIQRIVTKTQA